MVVGGTMLYVQAILFDSVPSLQSTYWAMNHSEFYVGGFGVGVVVRLAT